MRLENYIAKLQGMIAADGDQKWYIGLGEPHAWRGDYSQLAFEPVRDTTTQKMLDEAISCLGMEFTGYKGGEYIMRAETPCWIDNYGCWSRVPLTSKALRLLKVLEATHTNQD